MERLATGILPMECWGYVFTYLDVFDLYQVNKVCRDWRNSNSVMFVLKLIWKKTFLLPFPETVSTLEIFKRWTSPSDYPFKNLLEKPFRYIWNRHTDRLYELRFTRWLEQTGDSRFAALDEYSELVDVITKLEEIQAIPLNGLPIRHQFKTKVKKAIHDLSPILLPEYRVVDKTWSVYFLGFDTSESIKIDILEGKINIIGLKDTPAKIGWLQRKRGPYKIEPQLSVDEELNYYKAVMEMELVGEFPDGLSIQCWELPEDKQGRRLPKLAGSLIVNDSDVVTFIKTLAVCGYRAKITETKWIE